MTPRDSCTLCTPSLFFSFLGFLQKSQRVQYPKRSCTLWLLTFIIQKKSLGGQRVQRVQFFNPSIKKRQIVSICIIKTVVYHIIINYILLPLYSNYLLFYFLLSIAVPSVPSRFFSSFLNLFDFHNNSHY